MAFWELLLLAVGLSMDAFAIAVCKGLALDRVTFSRACLVGLWFGAFQAGMPLLGCFLGSHFAVYITAIDHWIAFGLLVTLGVNMLREAVEGETETSADLSVRVMLAMAVATSIDALAVGITFAFLEVQVLPAATLIGSVTFLLSVIGVKLGSLFGAKFRAKAVGLGGILLIILGLKILLEHIW